MSSNSVCDNQATFNTAVENAVKYVDKKHTPKLWSRLVMLGVMLLLVVWALLLSSRASGDKILHNVLALVVSPIYIIGYYLSKCKN